MIRAPILMMTLALAACGATPPPLPACGAAPVALNTGRLGGENHLTQPQPPQQANPIAPAEVSDNGQVTTFRFVGNSPRPAIFVVNPDGSERSVTAAAEGELVVVPTTAREFRLRSGGLVVCIKNENHSPAGVNYQTGTTSPDVIREVRRAGDQ